MSNFNGVIKNPARYQAYLEGEKWEAMRRRVLDRDRHICQGCLENRASEVHHRTYQNLFHEFAFELISLCRTCHERLHRQRGTPPGKNRRLGELFSILEKGVKAKKDGAA